MTFPIYDIHIYICIWKNKIHVPKHQPALSRCWLSIFVQQSQFLSWECSQLPKKATNDNWFNKPWINNHYIAGLPQGYLWNGFWIFVSAGPASDSVSQRFRQIISATTSSFQMVALMVTNQLRSLSHSVAELRAPLYPFMSYVLWHLVAATYAPDDAFANVGWTKLNISTFQNHEPSNLTLHQACTEN